MTRAALRVAAQWLRQQARTTALRHAAHLTDRRHRPRRVVTLPRDVKGRWTAQGQEAAS